MKIGHRFFHVQKVWVRWKLTWWRNYIHSGPFRSRSVWGPARSCRRSILANDWFPKRVCRLCGPMIWHGSGLLLQWQSIWSYLWFQVKWTMIPVSQMKMHHSCSVPTKVVHAKEGQLSHPTSSWDTGRGKGGIEASKRHLGPRGLGCCRHLAVGDGSSSQCNVQGSQKLHSNATYWSIFNVVYRFFHRFEWLWVGSGGFVQLQKSVCPMFF